MKYVFVVLASALVSFSRPASADTVQQAGACYTVNDADARAYCLARAHHDASRCYSIQKPDMRAMCRAEVRQ